VIPVIHVLIQELGLCVIHTSQTQAVKVHLGFTDCSSDDISPVLVTRGAAFVRFGQAEVFLESVKVLADRVDGLAALLVDRVSSSFHKGLEVLEDSLLLAITSSTHHFAQRLPDPSGEKNSQMATSRVECICNSISWRK
jgi:hypothetical protein